MQLAVLQLGAAGLQGPSKMLLNAINTSPGGSWGGMRTPFHTVHPQDLCGDQVLCAQSY